MIRAHLIAEAKEMSASPRWQNPDAPGSARIVELGARLGSPEKYGAFRETPDGDYLLSVIEAYEDALNDDWLPDEIIGLRLEHAREFIARMANELASTSAPQVIPNLRALYASLSAP